MDIKKKIEEIIAKIQADPTLLASFQKEPEQTIEKLVGVEIPDGVLPQLIGGVKTGLAVDQVAGAVDVLKKLF